MHTNIYTNKPGYKVWDRWYKLFLRKLWVLMCPWTVLEYNIFPYTVYHANTTLTVRINWTWLRLKGWGMMRGGKTQRTGHRGGWRIHLIYHSLDDGWWDTGKVSALYYNKMNDAEQTNDEMDQEKVIEEQRHQSVSQWRRNKHMETEPEWDRGEKLRDVNHSLPCRQPLTAKQHTPGALLQCCNPMAVEHMMQILLLWLTDCGAGSTSGGTASPRSCQTQNLPMIRFTTTILCLHLTTWPLAHRNMLTFNKVVSRYQDGWQEN